MSIDPIEDQQSAAVEQLERFGLSAYAARTFVELISTLTSGGRYVTGPSPRHRLLALANRTDTPP
ncbi:hypothetical protein SAMN04487948_11685 [Halogranum amylolyticum]|uniref:Uncharacterized protein n=1 Tax=Halogranum amylolyticum TaxID=660520 RepID=A0A1H8VGZ5_9EURY|nr:hypothetical protein SAMN04487948_11685 [Halogranum amylolyticum]